MALLDFDETDLIILNEALVNMPYRTVASLIEKVRRQLGEQRTTDRQTENVTRE